MLPEALSRAETVSATITTWITDSGTALIADASVFFASDRIAVRVVMRVGLGCPCPGEDPLDPARGRPGNASHIPPPSVSPTEPIRRAPPSSPAASSTHLTAVFRRAIVRARRRPQDTGPCPRIAHNMRQDEASTRYPRQ